jgi:hypothetical protein
MQIGGMKNMRRDMNIVREIVKQIGDYDKRTFSEKFVFENIEVSKELLDYHFIIMKDAGIIEGAITIADDEVLFYELYLGWKGNDFYETFKEDTVWERAKTFLKKKGLEIANMPFDILMETGKKILTGL